MNNLGIRLYKYNKFNEAIDYSINSINHCYFYIKYKNYYFKYRIINSRKFGIKIGIKKFAIKLENNI